MEAEGVGGNGKISCADPIEAQTPHEMAMKSDFSVMVLWCCSTIAVGSARALHPNPENLLQPEFQTRQNKTCGLRLWIVPQSETAGYSPLGQCFCPNVQCSNEYSLRGSPWRSHAYPGKDPDPSIQPSAPPANYGEKHVPAPDDSELGGWIAFGPKTIVRRIHRAATDTTIVVIQAQYLV